MGKGNIMTGYDFHVKCNASEQFKESEFSYMLVYSVL